MLLDPWPLLRKSSSGGKLRSIRLVVHGRAGGEVPACLDRLVIELQQRRDALVQIEVLTSDLLPNAPSQPGWLVPLLLLPGAHAGCVLV